MFSFNQVSVIKARSTPCNSKVVCRSSILGNNDLTLDRNTLVRSLRLILIVFLVVWSIRWILIRLLRCVCFRWCPILINDLLWFVFRFEILTRIGLVNSELFFSERGRTPIGENWLHIVCVAGALSWTIIVKLFGFRDCKVDFSSTHTGRLPLGVW